MDTELCQVADRETNGRYRCTRKPNHEGPCAAVPRHEPTTWEIVREVFHDYLTPVVWVWRLMTAPEIPKDWPETMDAEQSARVGGRGTILCTCGRTVPTTGDFMHVVRRSIANTQWHVRCWWKL